MAFVNYRWGFYLHAQKASMCLRAVLLLKIANNYVQTFHCVRNYRTRRPQLDTLLRIENHRMYKRGTFTEKLDPGRKKGKKGSQWGHFFRVLGRDHFFPASSCRVQIFSPLDLLPFSGMRASVIYRVVEYADLMARKWLLCILLSQIQTGYGINRIYVRFVFSKTICFSDLSLTYVLCFTSDI